MLVSHERHPQQQRLVDELLQPALVGEPGVRESEIGEGTRLAIDERADAELLREATQLAGRRGPLHEIHEMDLDPALGEEALRLARVGALLHAEDLDFHRVRNLTSRMRSYALLLASFALAACAKRAATTNAPASGHDHDSPTVSVTVTPPASVATSDTAIAPGAADAAARLGRSPRHSEWTTIRSGPNAGDTLRLFVVYPERSTRAPVVIVIHEIFGVTTWIESVADRLAADGFIAIAPDMLTDKLPANGADSAGQQATALIRALDQEWVQRQIDAAARYGMTLPAALPRYGIVGFCWGGSVSFAHAVHSSAVGAAVVYYGTSPKPEALAVVRAPVLGLYGEDDARVNATIPSADSAMRAMGKTYTWSKFAGAGHGFLRGQDQRNGANFAAARDAWSMTIQFFRTNLER